MTNGDNDYNDGGGILTPRNTMALIRSGSCTRPSSSRNSSHLFRGFPLVTSGLGPSSAPLIYNTDTDTHTHTRFTQKHHCIQADTHRLQRSVSRTYAGDEFESRLLFHGRVAVGPHGAAGGVERGVRRSEGPAEEIGDLGEAAEGRGVRVLHESL